jgi:hypothetical protein
MFSKLKDCFKKGKQAIHMVSMFVNSYVIQQYIFLMQRPTSHRKRFT